jgi:hypothetical protein
MALWVGNSPTPHVYGVEVYPELSSLLEGGIFFLIIASTIKEGTAIAKPTQPYDNGITWIQQRATKTRPTHRPMDVMLSNFN